MRLSSTKLSSRVNKHAVISPLRYILAGANVIPTLEATMGGSRYVRATRVIGTIGSGDVTSIRVRDQGWSVGTVGTNSASNSVSRRVWIKCIGLPAVEVTWGGSTINVIPAGTLEVLSDPISPIQLGFIGGVVPRGTRVVITTETTTVVGGKMIACTQMSPGGGTLYCLEYDPALGSATNLSTGEGGLSWTGSVTNVPSTWVCVQLVGTFLGGDRRSVLGVGDSIIAGVGRSTLPSSGGGSYFDRSLFQTDLDTSVAIAGCNAGCSSGVSSAWGSDATSINRLGSISKYANTIIEEYGINSIGYSGGQFLADSMYASSKLIWDKLKISSQVPGSLPVIIGRSSVLNKTSSDGLTPASGCGLGNTLDLINQLFVANEGVDFNKYLNMRGIGLFLSNDVTQSGNYQWNTSYSSDGLHPNEAGHIILANSLRAWLYNL